MTRFPYTQAQLEGDPVVTGTFDYWLERFMWFLCGIGSMAAFVAFVNWIGWL